MFIFGLGFLYVCVVWYCFGLFFLIAYIIFFDQNKWQLISCVLFNDNVKVAYAMSLTGWHCFSTSSYSDFWGWTDSSFHTSNITGIPPYSAASNVSSFNRYKRLRRHVYLHHLFIIVVCIFGLCYFYSTLNAVFHFSYSDSFFILFSSSYPSCTTSVLSKVKIHEWVRVKLSKSHWLVGFDIKQNEIDHFLSFQK